jgi:hypothetical protein
MGMGLRAGRGIRGYERKFAVGIDDNTFRRANAAQAKEVEFVTPPTGIRYKCLYTLHNIFNVINCDNVSSP